MPFYFSKLIYLLKMSWWDSKNFANLATKALKSAQEHIDKALDIREDGVEGTDVNALTEESTYAI